MTQPTNPHGVILEGSQAMSARGRTHGEVLYLVK